MAAAADLDAVRGLHADVVGSLLRPAALLDARRRRAAGELGAASFKAIEDAAVDDAVGLQHDAGLPVVTDGELRRLSFQSQLLEATEGFGSWDLDALLWGRWHGDERVGDRHVARPRLAVTERLSRRRFLSAEEFTYLRAVTDRVAKVTLPSPSLFASFWDPDRSARVYPTLEDFLGDVAELLRAEVDELARLGARYVQLDAPHYPLLVDPAYREFYSSRGWPAERWLAMGAELDTLVLADRPDMVTGFHLCKGNQQSRWLVAGGYEHIAAELFPRVRADRLLLEYDDERSGSFAPLAAVGERTVAVLGLVTTKHPRRETVEGLRARLVEASAFLPWQQLALSPQCGFAASVLGNALTVADQRRKLGVVAETAATLWP